MGQVKHTHHDLIVQWAEGAQIQMWDGEHWTDIDTPLWTPTRKYRVKPVTPAFITIATQIICGDDFVLHFPFRNTKINVRFTVNAETKEIVNIEYIKDGLVLPDDSEVEVQSG